MSAHLLVFSFNYCLEGTVSELSEQGKYLHDYFVSKNR